MRVIAVCFLIFFGVPEIGVTQNYSGFPIIKNYSADDYDGHIQNWGFTEDVNGVIYIANLQSVIRFDGVNWDKISIPNSRVNSILKAEDNRIYVGGTDEFGYLDKPENDSSSILQYYSLRDLVPDSINFGRIFGIESVEDTVVFQGSNYLGYYDGSSITYLKSKVRFSFLYKNAGEIFVRDALDGIKKVDKDTLSLIAEGDFFAENSLFSFLKLDDKELYCTYNQCFVFENEEFVSFETEADEYLATKYMDEAIVLDDGTILMATRTGGIVHLDSDGKLLQIINEEKGLISNTVYGIYEDKNGSVWAATINGISRIDFSLPLRFYDTRSRINESINYINSYQDNLVFSSSAGIYLWQENEQWPDKYEQNESCRKIIEIQEELFVICGGKLLKKDGSIFEQTEPLLQVREIARIDNELLIFGDESKFQIVRFTGQKPEVIYSFEDLAFNPVSLQVDKEKNIWVGTSIYGVYKVELNWDDGKITSHTTQQYFSDLTNPSDDNRVHVTYIEDNPLFLTWGKGIQRYNYETHKMEQITKYGELFSDTTRQFFLAEEDDDGNIWFRSDTEFQAALLQDDGNYKTYEGALKLINHRQNNYIYPDNKGYVWFATDQGLVRFNKRHNFDHSRPFHTQINKVLVRNDSLINGGNTQEEAILDYKDNELRFTFAGASYFEPTKTQYRVKLSGFDRDWTSWTNETQKDYTNIPEGNYSFVVQARNIFGVISESEPFLFSVLPPWYRTWWAYLLYTAGISMVLYLAYKIRINQILRVQRIRNNIASDLHDEVSATLSSISYFAQAIESEKVGGDKNKFVRLIADSAGEAKEKITDIVWAINPEHDDWQNFLAKCRRFASDLLESNDMDYSLKIDEYIPGKLDMQLRQHLWLIFKEMVTNAVRHAGARQLDIILKYEEGFLKLVVQDDGKGMDIDKVRKGNGLVNIHKRADQIKGEVSLKTSEGFGTRWMLKVEV